MPTPKPSVRKEGDASIVVVVVNTMPISCKVVLAIPHGIRQRAWPCTGKIKIK
jgi:hypothetical protein